MSSGSRLLAAAALFAASPSCLSAQDEIQLIPVDTRVRLSTIAAPDYVLTGTVASWDGQSLGLARPEDPLLRIPLSNLAKLDIRRGEKPNWRLGVLVGTGVGLLAGVIVASVGGPEKDELHIGDAAIVLGSTAAGIALGALTSLLFLRTDAWEDVPLP